MIASLMMYARPELEGAHDRFWMLIREELKGQGIEGPEKLSQHADMFEVWEDPELVLSQTCGMPYRVFLKEKVMLVGTPDYGLEGCPAGHYQSPIVVRKDDPRTSLLEFKDAIFGFNQTHSQSGFAAPYEHVSKQGFWFQNRLATGGHLASAQAVAEERADIAAIDGVTWRLIQKYEPCAEHLRVLEWTRPTPGLPLITSLKHDPKAVFAAVSSAISALEASDKALLGINALVRIPQADYFAIANPPETLLTR